MVHFNPRKPLRPVKKDHEVAARSGAILPRVL